MRHACVAVLLALGTFVHSRSETQAIDQEIERIVGQPSTETPAMRVALQKLLQTAAPQDKPKLLLALGLVRPPNTPVGPELFDELKRLDNADARVASGILQATMEAHAEAAKRWLRDAMADMTPDVDDMIRLRLLDLLSAVEEETGHFEEALRLRLQCLEVTERVGNERRIILTRSSVALLYLNSQDLKAARAFNTKALAQARAFGHPELLAQVLNTQAFVEADSGDSVTGLLYMQEALKLMEQLGNPHGLALFLANAADFSLKSQNASLATQQSEQALRMGRELDDKYVMSVALSNLAMAKIMQGQFETAKARLNEAIHIDEELGQISAKSGRLFEAAGYFERAGDLKTALNLYLQHRQLADQLFKEKQQRAMLEMQASYERKERMRELRWLREESALQEASLEGEQLQERTWLVIAIVSALTMALLARLWRQTQRTNQQLAQVNAQLLVQSERDPLTGLANRRRAAQVMAEQQRDGRWQGCLMLIDLDHFKRINDEFGHAAGDAVLVGVASRLSAAVRSDDLVVRWGGEEFLIATHMATPSDAEHLAQRVLDSLSEAPVQHERRSIAITASVGYACFPIGPGQLMLPWERAVDVVDTALYLAKAHGRNRAYGVKTDRIAHEGELLALASTLEEAWRKGDVDLQLLEGHAEAQTRGVAA
ncbi:GGDEF domain-containing protein [Ideonella paludis]|uniref:diguanylate cyclase n=2 Tax=Ideonella paludis TaxID=1233411 RepID=A0ABS5E0C9_9BURK|nr:GGDEF domain-containing protein [Ideonella paludis]MBQ0936870.1 GGDEF domain-containing protein [Ideonella paludis]